MKKVGIITMYGLDNYGNRLQNYAVQKVLTDMGLDAKSYAPDVYYFNHTMEYRIKSIFHKITKYRFTKAPEIWAEISQNIAYDQFTKRFLPTVKEDDLQELHKEADFFVIGSDQVWLPECLDGPKKEWYLLTFARPEQKICFSPSFGVSELPEKIKPWVKQQLALFPHLAVREEAGKEIIYNLTGQNAEVLIDPTLMLDPKQWLDVAKKPLGVDTKRPFILTYFLGQRTNLVENDIKELLSEKKRNVYHLLDKSQPSVYGCGPGEFLYLFSKADIILTDSFHASVFAFLFDKPFAVYTREQENLVNMTSRIETLLGKLKLDRKYRVKGFPNNWTECNYDDGWEALKIERNKVKDYLGSFVKDDSY